MLLRSTFVPRCARFVASAAARRPRWLLLVGFTISDLGAAVGGPLSGDRYLIVADSSRDRVVRLADTDGSGSVDPESGDEVKVFYDDESPGPDLSTPSALAQDAAGRLYLLDGGALDAILTLEDSNRDGDANDAGEFAIFYDKETTVGPALNTPNSLAIVDNRVFVADDGRGRGRILVLTDVDGDGNARGDGEWSVFYDSGDAEAAGATVVATDPEAMEIDDAGRVFVADATLGAIVLLDDLNADGDASDSREVTVFYDPRGTHPFADPEGLSMAPTGELFVTDEDTGFIARLLDADGNGVAEGVGEVFVFVDDTAALAPRDTNDLLATRDGSLLVLDGSRDQVFRLVDRDGDGAALSDGEVEPLIGPGEAVLGTPSALILIGEGTVASVSIRSVTPAVGALAGGETVEVVGHFPGVEEVRVRFGAETATVVAATVDLIRCVVPPASGPGPVDVSVSTDVGSATLAGAYRYLPSTEGSFVRGDYDDDGSAEVADAILILSYLFLGEPAPACLDRADANDDGRVNVTDPIYLLSHIFLGRDAPPPPFPQRGEDPTPDALPCS